MPGDNIPTNEIEGNCDPSLWQQSLWDSGVIRAKMHCGQAQIPRNYPVQAPCGGTPANLRISIYSSMPGDAGSMPFLQMLASKILARWIRWPPPKDLTAHKNVVGICHVCILRVLHHVKWPGRLWEFVENIEVSVILSANDNTEGFLLGSAHVLIIKHVLELFRSILTKELLAFSECESDFFAGFGPEKLLRLVNTLDKIDLALAALLDCWKMWRSRSSRRYITS